MYDCPNCGMLAPVGYKQRLNELVKTILQECNRVARLGE